MWSFGSYVPFWPSSQTDRDLCQKNALDMTLDLVAVRVRFTPPPPPPSNKKIATSFSGTHINHKAATAAEAGTAYSPKAAFQSAFKQVFADRRGLFEKSSFDSDKTGILNKGNKRYPIIKSKTLPNLAPNQPEVPKRINSRAGVKNHSSATPTTDLKKQEEPVIPHRSRGTTSNDLLYLAPGKSILLATQQPNIGYEKAKTGLANKPVISCDQQTMPEKLVEPVKKDGNAINKTSGKFQRNEEQHRMQNWRPLRDFF